MARTAKYTAPMQVVEEPWMRDAVKRIAEAEGVSEAAVFRSMHYYAIKWREAISVNILAGTARRPPE